jgi:hypothetical protein
MELAVHEAGHAVLLRHFDISLACVEIHGSTGRMPGRGNTKSGEEKFASSRDRAVARLAGFAAEYWFHKKLSSTTITWKKFDTDARYHSDRRCAYAAMSSEAAPDLEDEDAGVDRDRRLDDLVKQELKRAKKLVGSPPYWRAVTALAARLYEASRVTGEEATNIINEAIRHEPSD